MRVFYDKDTDPDVRSRDPASQMIGQPIGPAFEFAVSHRLVAEACSDPLGRAGDLHREQVVNPRLLRIVA